MNILIGLITSLQLFVISSIAAQKDQLHVG